MEAQKERLPVAEQVQTEVCFCHLVPMNLICNDNK